MTKKKLTQKELINVSKVCFLRVMKNFQIFPYLYRINVNKNREVWCKYPNKRSNPLLMINGQDTEQRMRRPNLGVQTTIPQETYDNIMDVVNEYVHKIIEPCKERRIDVAKFGEELFNQVGYKLYGEVFVNDMRILDEAMGNQHMPSSKEEFERFIQRCQQEYKEYLENDEYENHVDFQTFVSYKMQHPF